MQGVSFRRIRGKIVPIRRAADKIASSPIKRKAVKALAASGVIGATVGVGVGVSGTSKAKNRKTHLAAGYGFQILSGALAAIPTKGVRGLGLNLLGSVGSDIISSANFAKASAGLRGDQRKKLKDFAKHQAIGTGIGYATFGAGLLANKSVRSKALAWGAKIAKKVVFR